MVATNAVGLTPEEVAAIGERLCDWRELWALDDFVYEFLDNSGEPLEFEGWE